MAIATEDLQRTLERVQVFSITEYLATLPKTLTELTSQAVKKC